MNRRLRKIWICGDVWMDILPSFERGELGLKIALLSYRYDVLVDTHFDGKKELTIWRTIKICDGIGPEPKLSVQIKDKWVEFPFPDCPLPNKIRFKHLWITYIDHSVIEFLRSNKQIWDRSGTDLLIQIESDTNVIKPIWDVFTSEIWPIFATSIRHLSIANGGHLNNLRRLVSPTILTDLDQLNSIDSAILCPDGIADDGPNATAGQALSKWLHTPSKNGQPKRLFFEHLDEEVNLDWVNSFKEAFLCATASVSYNIRLELYDSTPIGTFEMVNERTKEKLTLLLVGVGYKLTEKWLLKRCPISEKAATDQWENEKNWDDNLNYVQFNLYGGKSSYGPYDHQRMKKKKRVKASKYRRMRGSELIIFEK